MQQNLKKIQMSLNGRLIVRKEHQGAYLRDHGTRYFVKEMLDKFKESLFGRLSYNLSSMPSQTNDIFELLSKKWLNTNKKCTFVLVVVE